MVLCTVTLVFFFKEKLLIENDITSIKNTHLECARYDNMISKSEKRGYVKDNVNKIIFDFNTKKSII